MASRAKAQISHVIMSNANSAKFGKDNLDAYMLDCVTKGAASSPSPPPRPYLPVPACVCPRVPTPTSLPMPSCARCYHGQVEPAGGPRARFVGPAPAQQLPKQPPHGVYCAPHAQIVSTCAIPAAIPAAIRAALPATTLRAAALRAAAPRAAALRAAAILAAAFRAAALRAVPACISSSEGGVQCVPLPHSVPHHPPSPHTTACHTDHTHHTHRTCHTHRTSHPPFSHSLCTCHTRHMLSILIILQFSPFSPFSSGGRQDGAADALGL